MDLQSSNKRCREPSDDNSIETKRFKIDTNILDLSDCVLTLIFENVNSFDLYALSLTCKRFSFLTHIKRLWTNIDVRSNPMCARKFKYFYSNINDSTKALMVSGVNLHEKCITNFQFQRIGKITKNLTVLAMEYQYVNSTEIQLRFFPPSLKELSLRGTQIIGGNSFFQEASVRLKNLHTLILDECKWIREHSLMALSKFNHLENLSLYKCIYLSDSVAYMSITTRFGFKKLLRIDARQTKMGDHFLKCLNNLRTIREIYLEAPFKRGRITAAARRTDCRFSHDNRFYRKQFEIISRDKGNRISDYCTETFRPCDKINCSFRPESNLKTKDHYVDNQNDVDSEKKQNIPQNNSMNNEEGVACSTSRENVIVVSPFENIVPPLLPRPHHVIHHHRNDVRVHVLYGHEAPCDFERQNGCTDEKSQIDCSLNNDTNEDDASDTSEDPNELLYNVYYNENDSGESTSTFYDSTVSDEGIRWFTASDPNAVDCLGQESILFRRPYDQTCECLCKRSDASEDEDWNKPGPSGMNNQPGETKDGSNSTEKKRRQTENENQFVESPGYRQKNQFLRMRQVHEGLLFRPPPPQVFNIEPLIPIRRYADLLNRLDVVLDNRDPFEHRDLRVVIERVEPGVQIVVNNNNNNQLHNNLTRLKVFVARDFKRLTDRALQNLGAIRLEVLDVTGTNVTADGIKQFLLLNPDCRVIHESTCVCNPKR